MAFCGKCGNQLEEGAKFCPKCGTPVVNNTTQTNEEPSPIPPNRLIKPFDIGDWLVLVLIIIVLIGGVFFGTRYYATNLHCKLFSWFTLYESPCVVAYNYTNCYKEGNTVGMMENVFTKGVPSRAKMKKKLEMLQSDSEAREAFKFLSNLLELAGKENGGIKDFTVYEETIMGSYAEVPIEFLYRNGLKETKRLKLRKDEDGVWGFKVVIND